DADLILVGATRHGRIGRLLLGTTAQRVLRGAPLPVMVVRYPLSERPARVLITSDLSELSGGVHELGLDVLESITPGGPAAELRSLVVVAPVPLPPPLRADEVRQIALQHLEKSLSNRRPRKSAVTAVARIGEPAEEVAMEAEE